MKSPDAGALGVSRNIFKVCELTREIRVCLERQFSDLWVEGEISDLRNPRSGHLYFTLKDPEATIKTVVFKSHFRFLRFVPNAGAQVLIRGRLSLYEPRGEYQLICDYIEPKGAGALQAAFEDLKQRLQKEGLFDLDRKKPLPALPVRVGVVTSPSGAAIQDIIKVIRQCDFHCHLFIFPVRVQGAGAADEIACALDEMNRFSKKAARSLDVLLLARGGGSLDDLRAFNEAPIAYAIARSRLPVISAIGHESDTTISDYAADLRAPTPSAAAEMIVRQGMGAVESLRVLHESLMTLMQARMASHQSQLATVMRLLTPPIPQTHFFRDKVASLQIRLHQSIGRLLVEQRGRLQKTGQGLVFLSPVNQLAELKGRLKQLQTRLSQEAQHMITQHKSRLQTEMDQLHLLSPLNILGRGYSITRTLPLMEVVRDAAAVDISGLLQIKLHKGNLICKVEEKRLKGGGDFLTKKNRSD